MSRFTVAHPVSGKPVELRDRLLPEHIEVGRFFWYDGMTSISSWSCPAVIIKVNSKKRQFLIKSLDDFQEHGWNDFDVNDNSCFTRQTMRLIDEATVAKYLQHRQAKLTDDVTDTARRHTDAKAKEAAFEVEVKKLGLKAEAAT